MGNTVSLSEPDEVLFAVWRKRQLDDNKEDEQYFDEFAHIANHTVRHRYKYLRSP
jgi:hypothetical protein